MQNSLGQQIIQEAPHGATQRTRAIDRIVATRDKQITRGPGYPQIYRLLSQALAGIGDQQVDNLPQVSGLQRMEENQLVNTIEQFGPEEIFDRTQSLFAHGSVH